MYREAADASVHQGRPEMTDPFIDCTTMEGQRRIRGYVLGWLERLDYAGKLDRCWPPDELGCRIWERVEQEFSSVWPGPIVANVPLARVIAVSMVEDYFDAYPERRPTRYSVAGPLPDGEFRRCVLDFVHDLEEYEPACLPQLPELAAAAFWEAVAENPERWGCRPELGPLVDDVPRARMVAIDAIQSYFDLRRRVERRRRETGA